MSEPGRGLPLLSGPPPSHNTTDTNCRRCGKEFVLLIVRQRKCNHCGYAFCYPCSDYQALMPRENGYDPMNVCGFCVEHLTITAAGRTQLKSMPLSSLRKYINGYNIETVDRIVEKDDLIDAIVKARAHNGCLPPDNEEFYRKHSVPNRASSGRSRNFFSSSRPPAVPRPPANPPPRPSPPEFARPDLVPDNSPPPLPPRNTHPNAQRPRQTSQQQQRQQPRSEAPRYPSFPEPQRQPQTQYQPPRHPPYSERQRQPQTQNQAPRYPPYPERQQPNQSPPQWDYGHARPAPSQSYAPPPYPPPRSQPSNFSSGPPPPPPRPASHPTPQGFPSSPPPRRPRAASTAPPPTLDQLISMPSGSISALSISVLKGILFTNHVNATNILEKGDLVSKVVALVEDEKKERERMRLFEEVEEFERAERESTIFPVPEGPSLRDERTVPSEGSRQGHSHTTGGEIPGQVKPEEGLSSSPKPALNLAALERSGLCVICQDEDANIAIVDCGHMAMCRSCSELVMSTSKECPLCRTRIVTEARLLRIFKS